MPVVGQFNASQCAVLVDGFGHELQSGNIAIVPDASFEIWREVAGVVDFRFLGVDHAPAAFGFHPAHGCQVPEAFATRIHCNAVLDRIDSAR